MAFSLEINDKIKIAIVTLCRLLLGITFVIFGFLRACNPVAGAYMVDKYLSAAGMSFFSPVSGILTVLFAAAEFAIGICSLLGTNIKKTSIYTALLIGFLTPFSFYTTYFAKVNGGGIGGSSVNGASCWIYLLFLAIAILIFVWREHSKTLFTERTEWAIGPICIVFSVCVSIISYFRLPMIDLTPYKTGTNIRQYAPKNKLDKNAISWDKKDHFSVKQMQRVQVEDGKIEAFQLYDKKKGDVTDTVLGYKGYTFLLVAEDLKTASTSSRHELNDLYDYARDNGYRFYCLTTSNTDSIETEEYIVESGGAEYPYLNADGRVLKLMIQSEPGLLLMKDGVIYRKWSNYNLPKFSEKLEKSKDATLKVESKAKKIFSLFSKLAIIFIVILGIDWFIGLMKWSWHKVDGKIKNKKEEIRNNKEEIKEEKESGEEKRESGEEKIESGEESKEVNTK